MSQRPEVLWCANARQGASNGWAFPPKVDRTLREFCGEASVLHLFGGRAKWGVRLDIDPLVRPDVIGDAWVPPFKRDAFDVVILDPPYFKLNQQMKSALLRAAAWVARRWVVWFHVLWIAGDKACSYERGWLVRVGDTCQVRCIQVFKVAADKPRPELHFTRGPAVKYNRWALGQYKLL